MSKLSTITNFLKFTSRFLTQGGKTSRVLTSHRFSTLNIDDDGDTVPEGMKTKVTVLSQEEDSWLAITAFSALGFLLNTGVRVMGPCAVFPRSVLHWNVRGVEDIHENSLALFPMLEPKLDILILGIGEKEDMSRVDPKIVTYLRSHKINVEILGTEQALATFNFLNSEKRYVAGAFIPPQYVSDDRIREKDIHYTNWSDDDSVYVSGGKNMDFILGEGLESEKQDDVEIPQITQEQRRVFKDAVNKFVYNRDPNAPKDDGSKEPKGDQH